MDGTISTVPYCRHRTVMGWARENGHVVFTHDLDFGTLLALTRASGPSVVQVRAHDVLPSLQQTPDPADRIGGIERVRPILGRTFQDGVEFSYPTKLRPAAYVARVFAPADVADSARAMPALIAIARVRPEVEFPSAAEEVRTLLSESLRQHLTTSIPNAAARAVSLHEEMLGRTRPVFLLLAAAAIVLLAVAAVALGATTRDILRSVIGGTLASVVAGLALGLGATAAAGRYLRPWLFETSAADGPAMVGTGSVLLVVAVIAALSPALHLSRVSPTAALRAE